MSSRLLCSLAVLTGLMLLIPFSQAKDQPGSANDGEKEYQKALSHFFGLKASVDEAEAAKWFEKAAKKGHPVAPMGLAFLRATGLGLPPDRMKADRLARAAAGKVRTLAGGFQLFARHGWLLNPRANRLWFQTVSHKGLRLLLPLMLLGVFVSNLFLVSHPFFQLTLAAQVAFYVTAALAWVWPGAQPRLRLLTLPYTICLFEWATIVAFLRVIRGRQAVTWERARVT